MTASIVPPEEVPGLESDIHLVETHQVRTTALHQIALGNLDSGASVAWFDARGNAATYLLDCEFRQTANLEIARAFTAYQHYELVRTLPGDLPWNLDLIILPCVASFYCDEDVPDAEGEHYPESARGMPVNWKKEPLNGLTSYEVPRGNARPHASKETAHASVLSDSRREAWGGGPH